MNEYATGSDGKILWCWECKESIRKGELIYPTFKAGDYGKFICQRCKNDGKQIIPDNFNE